MAITVTPSNPAAQPPSRGTDPTTDPTDDGFAALFALVAMPILFDAPPDAGTTPDAGEPPDGAVTGATTPQDSSSTSATQWEAAMAGTPVPDKAAVSRAEAAPIHLLAGEMPVEEGSTPAPVSDEAATDLTAPAPPAHDAATTIALPQGKGSEPHAADPHQVALSPLHDKPTPPSGANADLASESPPGAASPAAPAADPGRLSTTSMATAATLATTVTAATRTGDPNKSIARDHREASNALSAAITAETPTVARLAPPTPPPVATPVIPSQVATVVADHIRQSGPGRHRLEITLHPPELGRVEVHLVVGSHSVHAHLMAQSEAGRDALAHHIPTLREQLTAHGFTDAQVSVDLSGHGGDRQQRWQPQSPRPTARVEEATATTPRQPRTAGRRLLDRIV